MTRRGNGFGSLMNKGAGKPWLARWVFKGQVYYKSTGEVDKRKALKALERITRPFRDAREEDALRNLQNKIIMHQECREKDELLVADIWEVFKPKLKCDDVGPKTMGQYESTVKGMCNWFKNAKVKYAKDITAQMAEEYLEHLSQSNGADTYNIKLVLFKRIWNALHDDYQLRIDVWEKFKKKKTSKMSGRRALTQDEIANILSNAETHDMTLMLTLGLYTGLRLGDCATLKWDNVDFEKSIIRIVPVKTRKHMDAPVEIPIHPTLMKLLKETRHDSEYVSAANANGYLKGKLRRKIVALFNKCNIETSKKVDGKLKLICGFHSLRHTFVSMAINSGMSPLLVQKLVGHSAVDMTTHYFHENMSKMAEGINALPDVA